MLVPYIGKKISGKKNIVELTTVQDNMRAKKDERGKTDLHVTYDHTKDGIDNFDLISSHNSKFMKQKWRPVNTLAFLLNTTRTNFKTIHSKLESHVKSSGFEFTYCLGKIFVLPNIDRIY